MDRVPPAIVATMPSLVPRVNADGNETSGVPSVQARAPLGTYLGWNVVAHGYGSGGGCGFEGGFIPFARTKAERLASGDPRLQIARRAKEDPAARRLMTIPGIGPVTAAALTALAPAPGTFRCGRDFAAWVGLTPVQRSTGGKQKLGQITKAASGPCDACW